ncbi:hypothetical protein TNCV_2167301 [Trichonephila clavipes]|nr:hypothetical protein TNCV_2167301 [Trichonephila clavipes]
MRLDFHFTPGKQIAVNGGARISGQGKNSNRRCYNESDVHVFWTKGHSPQLTSPSTRWRGNDRYCETLRKMRRAIQKTRKVECCRVVCSSMKKCSRPWHMARRTTASGLTNLAGSCFIILFWPDLAPYDFHACTLF